MSTPPHVLFVLAHGIGDSNLAALQALAGLPGSQRAIDAGGEDASELLSEQADAAALLFELGVAVDRRGFLLRSRGDCDDSVVAALSQRPTGVAPATILELRSILEAGANAGFGAVPAAMARVARLIQGAASRLRRGDPTEIWLLGLGDLVAVRTTFDFAEAVAADRSAPAIAELRPRLEPGRVMLRPTSSHAGERALALLRGPLFRDHGIATPTWSGIEFLAADDVAFGRRPVAARAPNPGERRLLALLPQVRRGDQDLRGLIARFWMRAAAHADLRLALPAATPATVGLSVDAVRSPLGEPTESLTQAPTTTSGELPAR